MARVACGRSHTAAITATGGLYVWGSSALGTCLERHRRSCGSAYAALAVSTVLTPCPMRFTGQLGLDASTPVEWIDEFGRHHAVDQEERDTPFVAIPTPLRWSGMSRVGDMAQRLPPSSSGCHTCSCFRCRCRLVAPLSCSACASIVRLRSHRGGQRARPGVHVGVRVAR